MPHTAHKQMTVTVIKDGNFFDPSGRKQYISLNGLEIGPEQDVDRTTGEFVRPEYTPEVTAGVSYNPVFKLTRIKTQERGFLWVRTTDVQAIVDRANGV